MKRGLWVAAWGCWVWLGVGLHHQLPRHLGPVVGRLEASHLQLASSDHQIVDGRIEWNGHVIWKPSEHERMMQTMNSEAFLVKEKWDEFWNDWLPNLKYETNTWRRMGDASFIYRTQGHIVVYPKQNENAGDLITLADGNCYRLPLQHDRPLLALCQSILALPLILLWTILRWRRNRRLRLAGVRP